MPLFNRPYYFEVFFSGRRIIDLPGGLSDALDFNYRYVQLWVVWTGVMRDCHPLTFHPPPHLRPSYLYYIVAGEALRKHYIACPNNIVAIVLGRRCNEGRRVLQVTPCITLAEVTIVLYSLDFS